MSKHNASFYLPIDLNGSPLKAVTVPVYPEEGDELKFWAEEDRFGLEGLSPQTMGIVNQTKNGSRRHVVLEFTPCQHWTKKRICLSLLVEQICCKFKVLMLLLICSWCKFVLGESLLLCKGGVNVE